MRLFLFDKGNYLSNRIEVTQNTENMIALKVNGRFEVLFYYKGHKLVHSCDCKDGSIEPNKLCAHSIAGIKFLCEHLSDLKNGIEHKKNTITS
jgi:hypothetical protein